MKKTFAISAAMLLALSMAVHAGGHNQASENGRANGGKSAETSGGKSVGPNGTPPGQNKER